MIHDIQHEQMNKTGNRELLWIFSIMAFALLLRLYKIDSPILDLYPTRQEQCAMIARNFYRHGFDILHPEVDWFGRFDPSWRIEFPLISYIAAILYSIFGLHEFLGRLVSVAFSIGCVYIVYNFAARLYNLRTAKYASILFTISPLGIYFGRAFMSDTAMLFFSITSLYCFYLWIKTERWAAYGLAIISTSLALLLKLTSLYLFLPLIFLACLKHKCRVAKNPAVFLFFIISIAPALLWYAKASNNMLGFYILNKSNFAMLIRPEFYRRILETVSLLILTPPGIILAAVGLFSCVSKPDEYLLHYWLLALACYTIIAPEVNYIHYHYQLPLLPIFAMFAGKTIDKFSNPEIYRSTIFTFLKKELVLFILISIMLIFSIVSIMPFYKFNRVAYEASKTVSAITDAGSIIIAGRSTQQAPLYYTNRKGWETNEQPEGSLSYSWAANLNRYNFPKEKGEGLQMPNEAELIKFLIQKGADYYFTTNMEIFDKEPDFREFMNSNFKILKNEEGFVIFKLNKR